MQESDFEHETDLEHEPIECHGQRSPVNVAIPPTAPSREDIMYQGPGGCIVGKYNVTNVNVFSDCLECPGS